MKEDHTVNIVERSHICNLVIFDMTKIRDLFLFHVQKQKTKHVLSFKLNWSLYSVSPILIISIVSVSVVSEVLCPNWSFRMSYLKMEDKCKWNT